jgi:hypothetical protein
LEKSLWKSLWAYRKTDYSMLSDPIEVTAEVCKETAFSEAHGFSIMTVPGMLLHEYESTTIDTVTTARSKLCRQMD